MQGITFKAKAAIVTKSLTYFGAAGNGLFDVVSVTNNTEAFIKAGIFFSNFLAPGDEGILTIPSTFQGQNAVYYVGKQIPTGQSYTVTCTDIMPGATVTSSVTRTFASGDALFAGFIDGMLYIENTKNKNIKITIEGSDAQNPPLIKYVDGLYFGSFIKTGYTYTVYDGGTPPVILYQFTNNTNNTVPMPEAGWNFYNSDEKTKAWIGHFIGVYYSDDVTIKHLRIDGNNTHFNWGGTYGDRGIQLPHTGISCKESLHISIDDVVVNNMGFDGILIDDGTENVLINNSHCIANTRGGLSWTGGKWLTATNCQFNESGKGPYSPTLANPGTGLDIEPDIPDVCENGSFTNCEFSGNNGPAISNAPLVAAATDNMQFENCTMYSNREVGIICTGKKFFFENCKIYARVLYSSVGNVQADATHYKGCVFEDRAYNNTEHWDHPKQLIEISGYENIGIAMKWTFFEDCDFRVNDDNREMFKIWSMGPTANISEATIFDNCNFTYNNDGNTTDNNTSILSGILFKGNNLVKNTNTASTSKHQWQMNSIEIEGSENACAPNKFEVEGNFIMAQLAYTPNILLFGKHPISNNFTGFLKATFKRNAMLRFPNNITLIGAAANITIGDNSSIAFEASSAIFGDGTPNYIPPDPPNDPNDPPVTLGYDFNIYGHLILKDNSYFTFDHFKFYKNAMPQKSLFYIDEQAIGNAPSFWYPTPLGIPVMAAYDGNTAPCIEGGNPNLPLVVMQCTIPPNLPFKHISTNEAFTIMYNLTPNGGNTNISISPFGLNYTVEFDGVQMGANISVLTGVPDGCHLLIVTDNNGCSALAVITTGANTAPCCEPSIDNPTNLKQYINPTVSGLIPLLGANVAGKSFLIEGTFEVDQNINFTNCTFYMKEGAVINIQAGVVCTLAQCTLRAACESMWDGIYASDPTTQLVMNDCTMKDAEKGVMLTNNAKGTITENTFINNHENIQIYGNTNANNCVITKNEFTYEGALLSPYVGEKPLHGIYIDNSSHVDIGNVNDANSGNHFNNIWNGVTTFVHSYVIGDFPYQQIMPYPYTKIQLFNNEFKDINQDMAANAAVTNDEVGSGVYGMREDPFNELRVNVFNTLVAANNPSENFENCFRGVWLRRASGSVDQQKIKACTCGIIASECEGRKIRVTNNILTSTYLNILKLGDEMANGFYAQNNKIVLPYDYNNIAPVGIPPLGIASVYGSLVHVGKSIIQNNTIDMPTGFVGLGIMLGEGSSDKIYSNKIHMKTVSEQVAGIPKMLGIYSNNSDGVNMVDNTIDNGGGGQYVRTNSAGIYINNNKNSYVQCNNMNYTKYGIFAVGQNGSTTLYDRTVGNYMNNSDANLMLWKLGVEGSMGQLGIDDQNLNVKYDANNTYNEPQDINPMMTSALFNKVFRVTDCAASTIDEIVTTVAKLDQSKSSASNINANDCRVKVPPPPPTFTTTFTCPVGDNNGGVTTAHPIDIHYAMQVASGEIDYSEYLEGARRADEELVQQWLENNESARTSSAILDSFYNANNAGIVGALYDIDKQISLLNDSSLRSTPVAWMVAYELARSMNNGLNGNEVFEQNAKYINDLYLNAILRGRDTLNAEQRDDVETLAYTCPYLGGNAVYRARLLHGMWHWGIHYDDLEICNGQGVFKNGISKLQEQLNMLKNYKKYEQVKKK
jgi:hypothetical protein